MNVNTAAMRVLVYGDSITYGRFPKLLKRYGIDRRWTGVLQNELGEDYEIIEEGLRARMLSGTNPNFEDRDGLKQFGPILGSHLGLDLVIVFLGTNDMNEASNKTPEDIANSLDDYFAKITWWAQELQIATEPKVLIVAPPLINESVLKEDTIFKGGGSKSKALAPLYRAKAKQHEAFFFNAAEYVSPDELDGVHLDEDNNRILATELAAVVRNILS